MTSSLRRGLALGFAASLVALVSCEAIVGDTIPGFTCSGTSADACPPGQYCNGSGCKACESQDVCDHLDNDCNGKVDDGPLSDADGDGFSWCGNLDATGHPTDVDCDDHDKTVYPGAPEICDGKDNDCNGLIDDGATCTGGESCFAGKCVNACDPDASPGCGVGQHCDTTTHTCVNNTTVGIGKPCRADVECDSPLFCADATVVGDVVPTPGEGMCTQDCCTSANCPTGFVCYEPGSGGRYCVDPTKIGRTANLGSELPGASETQATRCRSGLVAGGRCADTCCADSDCGGGTSCAYGSASGHDGFFCVTGTGGGNDGDFCWASTDCRDLVCGGVSCVAGCCSSSACAGNGEACVYASYNNSPDAVPLCAQGQLGSGARGATCKTSSDCATNFCFDDISKGEEYCSDACCTDADCGAGFLCRPTPDLPRCVKQ
ncbi:MAG TPA: putative metal-binding motif-containing protein [Polyangiaceae bacterium]